MHSPKDKSKLDLGLKQINAKSKPIVKPVKYEKADNIQNSGLDEKNCRKEFLEKEDVLRKFVQENFLSPIYNNAISLVGCDSCTQSEQNTQGDTDMTDE